MKHSLNRSLLAVTLSITLICAGAIVTFALERSFTKEAKLKNELIIMNAEKTAIEIQSYLDDVYSNIHSLALTNTVKKSESDYTEEQLENHEDVIEKCLMFSEIVKMYNDRFENIAFYDKEGNVRIPTGKVKNLGGKEYLTVPITTGKDFLEDPRYTEVNDASKSINMFLSTVVKDKNENPIGCLVAVVRQSFIDNVCLKLNLTPEADYSYYPVVVNLKTEKILSAVEVENTEDFQKEVVKLSKQKGVYIYNNGTQKMISVTVPVEGYDWGVVAMMPYDYQFGEFMTRRYIVWLQAFSSLAILGLIMGILFHIKFKPLKMLDKSMSEVANGNADLTKRIEVKSKDEVGDVVQGFNMFIEMLQKIMQDINKSKNSVAETYKKLNENVLQNKANIEKSMNALMNATSEYNSMNGASETTAAAMVQINSNIDSLNKMIANQSMAITEASSSIEEMIGNISSVTNSVEIMNKEFEMLTSATTMGINKNNSVNDKLIKMQESSKVLLEANKAIQTIASQTNLLAMNAAIEAAHAGQFGKGFAVVADEIRKLAEDSAKQSKTIGNELKEVSEQIETVVYEAHTSTETFKKVGDEIASTSQLVLQIRNAMEEQGEGSKQVLEALTDMNSLTSEVRNASEEMKNGSQQVNNLMSSLSSSQLSLKKAFNEMDIQISNMQESTSNLNKMNKDLGKDVKEIEEKVNQFKI